MYMNKWREKKTKASAFQMHPTNNAADIICSEICYICTISSEKIAKVRMVIIINYRGSGTMTSASTIVRENL